MKCKWIQRIMLIVMVMLLCFPQKVQAEEKKNILRVGTEANYAPFNWTETGEQNDAYPIANSNGEYATGYDVWMAKQIADGLGMELEIVKIEWEGLPPALLSGKIDAIIAGMSPTAERKEIIDFTDTYYTSDLVLVVQKDSPLAQATTLDDFADKKVVGQLNTFHDGVIDQIEGVDHITPMDTFPTMISALKAGKVDAYVSERPGAMAATVANDDLTYVVFEEGKGFATELEDTSIAIGIRKGDVLKEEINTILSGLSEEKRQNAMEQMIYYNAGVTPPKTGFLGETKGLLESYGPLFLRGILMTMGISIVSTVIGFIIGLVVQVARLIPLGRKKYSLRNIFLRILRFFLTLYIEVFRGTPMMVQAMLIFYGSKLFFNVDMSSAFAAILIVSINTGAYLAEVIRGGIDAVDPGQKEAADAIGLSHGQMMRHVILPQTVKAILPSVANEFVVNIKDTSVLNVISVTELFFVTKSVAGSTYLIFQSYLIAAAIYLVLTFVTTRIISYLGYRSGRKRPFSLSSVTGGVQ